jgi:RNA polymerase sigma-70 factor, ECF subfamily
VPPSDAELARDALAGSEEASRALVARYATPAVNFIFRLVHDRPLAEDLAQEAFLRVFQKLKTYDRERKFSSWFFQVVRNVTIDHLRVHRLQTSSLDGLAEAGFQAAEVPGTSASPERVAEQRALGDAMERALAQLRPEYREAVVLRYHEGLTHVEIGEVLGLPDGTVKTYLHRARKELAELLTAEGWGPAAGPEA